MKYSTLETSILHTYSGDPDLFANCENLAFEEIWAERANQIIFRIIKENHSKKAKTDLHLLKNGLIKAGYSKEDITQVLQNFHNSDSTIKTNIVEHMRIVFEVYCRRVMKPIIHRAYNQLFTENGDIDENVNTVKDVFNQIDSIKNNLSSEKSVYDIHDETFEDLMKAQNHNSELIGYSYGLTELDKITNGAKQEDVLLIAPPACGKSSFMVNTAKHIAIKQKKPVVIFSLEMSAKQVMMNFWSSVLQINSYGIRSGQLSDENLLKIKNFKGLLKDNLFIDDTSGITWQYVETKIRQLRRKIPLDQTIVVIIDYVQIMRNIPEERKGTSKEEQQSLIANGLMELSKKYNLCMIKLSQIGREVGKRDNKEPTMADAKGSGAWEANAAIVLSLYRADYYDPLAEENGMSLKGLCKINVLKNRYGPIGHLYAKFLGHLSSFEDFYPEGITTKNYRDDVF